MKSKILSLHPEYQKVENRINAAFSFRPYVNFLKQRVQNVHGSSPDLYRYIVSALETNPDLLKPIEDDAILEKNYDVIQLTVSSLFAITNAVDHLYFHLSVPYRFEIIYQSHANNSFFFSEDGQYLKFHEGIGYKEIALKQEFLAYRMIFRKFYHFNLAGIDDTVFSNLVNGERSQQYRLYIDESFVDVQAPKVLPLFPALAISDTEHSITDLEELRRLMPLSLFRFEGFLVRRIEDTSTEQAISDVKNALIDMHTDEEGGYDKLSKALSSLLNYQHAVASFIPFIRLNSRYILPSHFARRSLFFNSIDKEDEKEQLYDKLGVLFREDESKVEIDVQQGSGQLLLDRWLHLLPYRYYSILPLYDKSVFLGIVEICHDDGISSSSLLQRIDQLIPYLQLGMRNSIRHFHTRLAELMKEHFTHIQPSVEWKFAESAWNYMRQREKSADADMASINFDAVYPVYGMIDIRNSSGERTRCVQRDLLDQLDLITETINKMRDHVSEEEREHLNNILFRNGVMRSRVENILLAEDEMRVSDYLEHEIRSMFRHFGRERSEIDKLAKNYLHSVDQERGFLFRHRRDFDASVSAINGLVSRYLVAEEAKLQRIFPHYFDKYKTDGIEYDIYIGDSISRNRQFDHMYLRNLRLWQLSSMVEITRKTAALIPELKIPLQTTQLILVYSHPICITFRNDERRFDVEGGTNIRYELIKKRIDKVKVRNSGERLTQPDKIAIVYTQAREADEYREYIRLLQRKNMLAAEIETLDLEEVQGLSGLRAIRVAVLR